MGLFSSYKASNTYDRVLTQFGINPRNIPASVSAKICSDAEKNYKQRDSAGYGAGGLQGEIANAAELVAYCVIGRKAFIDAGGATGAGSIDMVIKDASADWLDSRYGSTLDIMIIKTLEGADLLCSEFMEEFNSM